MSASASWNTGDPLRSLPSTYCGRKAVQWWVDFLLWENLLNLHPEVEGIVELGTGDGGFSLYLFHQAAERGIGFVTFDIETSEYEPPGFYCSDIFADVEGISMLLDRATILHCDDGDKPRELATFAPHLQPGSLCVVHDWGIEVGETDVPDCLAPVCEDLWRGVGLSAVFERKP